MWSVNLPELQTDVTNTIASYEIVAGFDIFTKDANPVFIERPQL